MCIDHIHCLDGNDVIGPRVRIRAIYALFVCLIPQVPLMLNGDQRMGTRRIAYQINPNNHSIIIAVSYLALA